MVCLSQQRLRLVHLRLDELEARGDVVAGARAAHVGDERRRRRSDRGGVRLGGLSDIGRGDAALVRLWRGGNRRVRLWRWSLYGRLSRRWLSNLCFLKKKKKMARSTVKQAFS